MRRPNGKPAGQRYCHHVLTRRGAEGVARDSHIPVQASIHWVFRLGEHGDGLYGLEPPFLGAAKPAISRPGQPAGSAMVCHPGWTSSGTSDEEERTQLRGARLDRCTAPPRPGDKRSASIWPGARPGSQRDGAEAITSAGAAAAKGVAAPADDAVPSGPSGNSSTHLPAACNCALRPCPWNPRALARWA